MRVKWRKSPNQLKWQKEQVPRQYRKDRHRIAWLQPKPDQGRSPTPALVRVLQDMDTFMGVDGRVYTLSKGDIVTLPERNAAVLTERNIVLNINLCK